MRAFSLTSITSGLGLVCILLLNTPPLCECVLSQRHGPRHLLQAHPSGTSARTVGKDSASAAPRVEQLVLWHTTATGKLNTTSSRPNAARNGSVPVNFSVYYPSTAQQQLQGRLPVLFLLNGANVEAKQYSTLAHLLNDRGYTFVASDLYQPLSKADQKLISGPDPAKNWTLPASCPRDKLLGPSAALIQTFVNHVRSQPARYPALTDLESRGIVLVGHSMGGSVATNILGHRCSAPDGVVNQGVSINYCQGYQPPLRTTACGANKTGNTSVASDGKAHSSSSSSSAPASTGLIRGVVVYEGYRSQPAPQSQARNPAALTFGSTVLLPVGEQVPPGMFLLLLSGQYGAPKVQRVYKLSNTSSCSCIGSATFAGLNHFGINNYQPNTTAQGVRQLTPCGRPATSDPVGFRVTQAHQDKQLANMASLIDAFIKAQLLKDTRARQQLQQLAATGSSRTEFTWQAKPGCLV